MLTRFRRNRPVAVLTNQPHKLHWFFTLCALRCSKRSCCTNAVYSKAPRWVIHQEQKGGRCDISVELMNIGFSRPKFNAYFWVIRLVRGRFRDMRPFIYGFFRKTAYGWNHQINCLLFTDYYRYDISLAIKKFVMEVTYEYMMTSSDQILRIFSRSNDPIYSDKLVLITLAYILLL